MAAALQTHRVVLAAVLLAGLAIRLGWGPLRGRQPDPELPDQREYIEMARNLLAGNGLGFHDERFGQYVRAYRMPGYPLFLALCGASVAAAQTVQAVVDTLTALGVYVLARTWLPPAWSALAAALTAFNPLLIYLSNLILSETLCTALVIWGAALLLRAGNPIYGAGVLALSVLVRPAMLGLPTLMCIAVGMLRRRCTPRAPSGELTISGLLWRAPGTLSLVLVLAALFPWAVRNRVVLGEWIWLTTNGGITRYDGFHPGATGASDQRFLNDPQMSYLRLLGEVERDRYLALLATRHVRDAWRTDPPGLLRLALAKILRTWSPRPLSEQYAGRPLYVLAAMAWSLPFMFLAVIGAIFTAATKGADAPAGPPAFANIPRAATPFLLLPALYVTAVCVMSVGSLRYRAPAEPFLALLAVAGVLVLWRAGRRVGSGRAAHAAP